MASLPLQDVYLRVHLDRRRRRLQLPYPGELPDSGEITTVSALLPTEVVARSGTRFSFGVSFQSWAAISLSKTSTSIQQATTRSVRRTSRGVGFSPATSSRIISRRPDRASSVRGDPPKTVSMRRCCALRPTSEALATTAGEDSLSFCLSSFLAS